MMISSPAKVGNVAQLPDNQDVREWAIPEAAPEEARVYPEERQVTGEMRVAAVRLRDAVVRRLQESPGVGPDFTVMVAEEGRSVGYRVHRGPTIGGVLLTMRRLPARVPDLDALLPAPVTRVLLSEDLIAGGLVVAAGAAGHGKSTTLAATVMGRLQAWGGVCITVEDPPEMPLHGAHGSGVCYQTEIGEGHDLTGALKGALRQFPAGVPGMLMVGEIRDAPSARQLMQAAINGLLVLCTVHAGGATDALRRILALAGADGDARDLLAASLRLVVHQRLSGDPGRRRLDRIEPLAALGEGAARIEACIRGDRLEQLGSEVQRQVNRIAMGRELD